MIYLGNIYNKLDNNTYSVLVPELGQEPLTAVTCSVKGITTIYDLDETVFISQLGANSWVILGYLKLTENASVSKISVEQLEAKTGILEDRVTLGGISGKDLARLQYSFNFQQINSEEKGNA